MDHQKNILVATLKGNTADTPFASDEVEIIQVALVLVNKTEMNINRQFHCYVRPKLKEKLDEKCKESYHIYQFSIDHADFWPRVEEKIDRWLRENGLSTRDPNFVLAVDGNSGFDKLIKSQCRISGTAIPEWTRRWANIRSEFESALNATDHTESLDIHRMARMIGVSIDQSKKGDGRDEAFDLAMIVLSLIRRGHRTFERVETLPLL